MDQMASAVTAGRFADCSAPRSKPFMAHNKLTTFFPLHPHLLKRPVLTGPDYKISSNSFNNNNKINK